MFAPACLQNRSRQRSPERPVDLGRLQIRPCNAIAVVQQHFRQCLNMRYRRCLRKWIGPHKVGSFRGLRSRFFPSVARASTIWRVLLRRPGWRQIVLRVDICNAPIGVGQHHFQFGAQAGRVCMFRAQIGARRRQSPRHSRMMIACGSRHRGSGLRAAVIEICDAGQRARAADHQLGFDMRRGNIVKKKNGCTSALIPFSGIESPRTRSPSFGPRC